jgi:hypothetical protein
MRFSPRYIFLGLFAAAPLAGCGIVPGVAQQTTAAALAPFTTAAQAVGTDLMILQRAFASMSPPASRTLQATRPLSQPVINRVQPTPVSYPAPSYRAPTANSTTVRRDKNRSSKKDAAAKNDGKPPPLDIMPADVLKRLTADQAILQHAAQQEAATAAIGETIFWHYDGREGSAMAESESQMGRFTCRVFVQTLAFEDDFEKVSATACHTGNGAWTQSF